MKTIKEIAQEANVSEGTVDRVLHNRGGVSKKTETKIKAIIKAHNFSVNPVASALALKNKFSIAALIPVHNTSDLFWKSPNIGITKAAEDIKTFGTQVLTLTYNQQKPESYINAFNELLKSNPSAFIIAPSFSEETKEIVAVLEAKNIPYIFLNIEIEGFNNLSFVGQDAFTAGYIAAKLMQSKTLESSSFLIIQSRKNITNNNAVFKRIEGFTKYFIEHNIPHKILTLEIENQESKSIRKTRINTYLKNHPDIKGVFVPSSRIHMIVDSMKDEYLNNIELIGFDNTPQNVECLMTDSVSYLISQKPFDQGYNAIKLMNDYLVKNTIPDRKIYLPIDILIKENVIYNENSY
ncbi:substrate-binding domain-containing protein [Formosa sediminum]|uniref:Substrate-binding domain-containing protein n=1 Tax=Formosa sediminum TaxID=2594004 RepID=A0A516GUK0_9FLAO|nr:LacI family DNA-binding transcriptional regulator [Formosa sediminum]QDO95199.1 substrate-binding domain-containing protein [Formosa sediminum]